MTLNERGALAVVGAEDQVAFPVTGHGPILHRGGARADRGGIADLALSCIPGMLVPREGVSSVQPFSKDSMARANNPAASP